MYFGPDQGCYIKPRWRMLRNSHSRPKVSAHRTCVGQAIAPNAGAQPSAGNTAQRQRQRR